MVEGTMQEDASGWFIDARRVDVRRAKIVRIEAEVDSVSPDANDPRIGTFVVPTENPSQKSATP